MAVESISVTHSLPEERLYEPYSVESIQAR